MSCGHAARRPSEGRAPGAGNPFTVMVRKCSRRRIRCVSSVDCSSATSRKGDFLGTVRRIDVQVLEIGELGAFVYAQARHDRDLLIPLA